MFYSQCKIAAILLLHKEIEWGFFSLLIVSSPVMHMPQVRKWNISFVVLLDNHYHANEHNESKWDCVIGMHFLVLWFHLWLRPLQTARSHKTMKITLSSFTSKIASEYGWNHLQIQNKSLFSNWTLHTVERKSANFECLFGLSKIDVQTRVTR